MPGTIPLDAPQKVAEPGVSQLPRRKLSHDSNTPHRIPSPWCHKLDHITSGSLSRKCQGEQNSVATENLRVYFCWSPWSHLSTSFVGGKRSPQTPQKLGRYPRHWDIFKSSMVEDRNLILMAVAMPMWEILDHAPHGPFLHRNSAWSEKVGRKSDTIFFNLLGDRH